MTLTEKTTYYIYLSLLFLLVILDVGNSSEYYDESYVDHDPGSGSGSGDWYEYGRGKANIMT